MKHKVGDKVRIKSIDWYNENKNHCGEIPLFKPSGLFVPDMSRYCNNIMTIKDMCYGTCYRMKEDFWNYNWTDEMIEELVEEESLTPSLKHPEDSALAMLFHKTLILPQGYQFKDENGNVINATKIVLEKKKKEYPKTYEECCKVLGYSGNYNMILTTDVDNKLFNALYRLKVCRDAYWKIAGDEMGLGKPWEPDYTDPDQDRYAIVNFMGNIEKSRWDYGYSITFVFPTEEMRDAFKENFDPDIEICKELL